MSNIDFKGYSAALLATAIWGGNFVAARALAFAIPPCQFNFWRWVIAFAAILPFAWPHLRQDLAACRGHFGYLSLMAFLGVTLMNAFVYKAGQTTTSLNMALIMPATPALILVLARIFYGEAISRMRLLGMAIASLGIVILVSGASLARLAALEFRQGDIWTLGCMFSFGLYSLLMRKRPQGISAIGFNAVIFGLGLVYALPFLALEMWLLPLPRPSWPLFAGLLYSGLGCSTLAFWLWTRGIDLIGPVRAGIVYYTLPFFAAAMARVVLGESVTPAQIWGGCLIIGGILLATLNKTRP